MKDTLTVAGSALVVALFAMANTVAGSGCFYTGHTGWRWSVAEPFETIVSDSAAKDCYVTEHGVLVQALGGSCPAREDVERETLRILDDAGADPLALLGYVVVFSAARPTCNRWGDCDGMTDGNFAVVHYLDWPRVMRHEMFHVLLQAELGDSDANHWDPRWEWYGLWGGR